MVNIPDYDDEQICNALAKAESIVREHTQGTIGIWQNNSHVMLGSGLQTNFEEVLQKISTPLLLTPDIFLPLLKIGTLTLQQEIFRAIAFNKEALSELLFRQYCACVLLRVVFLATTNRQNLLCILTDGEAGKQQGFLYFPQSEET